MTAAEMFIMITWSTHVQGWLRGESPCRLEEVGGGDRVRVEDDGEDAGKDEDEDEN